MSTGGIIGIIGLVFIPEWPFSMCFPISGNFFLKGCFIMPHRLFDQNSLRFLSISPGFNMGSIDKQRLLINVPGFDTLFQNLHENLLKKIGVFKTAAVVFSKSCKMGNCFIKI